MSQEVELKLDLNPGSVEQFLALSWFHESPAIKECPIKTLENRYFDTPDLLLLKSRAALRIRKSGDAYVQTLKTKGVSVGGLHQRGEWEHPISLGADGEPELQADLFPQEVWPKGVEQHLLMAVFDTNFERRSWIWTSSAGSRIEVVLDRGVVVSGEQTTDLCEIELELLEGQASCLFDLAEAICKCIPATVSDITKAQRGFDLFQPGVWVSDNIQWQEGLSITQQFEAVLQLLGSLNLINSNEDVLTTLTAALDHLVADNALPEWDVKAWLVLAKGNALDETLRGQWLLRLARHAWLYSLNK